MSAGLCYYVFRCQLRQLGKFSRHLFKKYGMKHSPFQTFTKLLTSKASVQTQSSSAKLISTKGAYHFDPDPAREGQPVFSSAAPLCQAELMSTFANRLIRPTWPTGSDKVVSTPTLQAGPSAVHCIVNLVTSKKC